MPCIKAHKLTTILDDMVVTKMCMSSPFQNRVVRPIKNYLAAHWQREKRFYYLEKSWKKNRYGLEIIWETWRAANMISNLQFLNRLELRLGQYYSSDTCSMPVFIWTMLPFFFSTLIWLRNAELKDSLMIWSMISGWRLPTNYWWCAMSHGVWAYNHNNQ